MLKQLRLFIASWPLARARVIEHLESRYPGSVRHQICYNQVRTDLVRAGKSAEEEITGAVVHVAVGLAYLLHGKVGH